MGLPYMSRFKTKALSYAFTLALCTISSQALTETYIFRESDASETMLQKTTTALLIARSGHLWIGTQQGLHAYTGIELTSYYYDPATTTGLQSDNISAIAETLDGTIIIGTRDRGAYSFDPLNETFSSLLPAVENEQSQSGSVYALYVDSSDRIWIGVNNGYRVVQKIGNDDRYELVAAQTKDRGAITGFAENAAGIWTLSSAEGVELIDEQDFAQQENFGLLEIFGQTNTQPEASGLYKDSDGRFWIWSINHDLVAIDPENKTIEHRLFSSTAGAPTDLAIYAVVETEPGFILIGTSRGPFEFRLESGELRPVGETFFSGGSPTVTSITLGENDTVWLGSLYGPVSGTPRLFGSISTLTTDLPSDSINTLMEGEAGLWLGTENGLTLLDESFQVLQSFNDLTTPRLSDPTVMAIERDQIGLWIGTFNGGLNRFFFDGSPTEVYRSDKKDPASLGANGVTSILRTKNNTLLIGTYGGGLNIFNPNNKSFRRHVRDDGSRSISNDKVLALYQCSLGKIYIGTEAGLNIFDESTGEFKRIFADSENENSLRSDFIWSFYEDAEGDLWIASYRGGISRWRKEDRENDIPRFTHAPAAISNNLNTILGIAEDPDGFIWGNIQTHGHHP